MGEQPEELLLVLEDDQDHEPPLPGDLLSAEDFFFSDAVDYQLCNRICQLMLLR